MPFSPFGPLAPLRFREIVVDATAWSVGARAAYRSRARSLGRNSSLSWSASGVVRYLALESRYSYEERSFVIYPILSTYRSRSGRLVETEAVALELSPRAALPSFCGAPIYAAPRSRSSLSTNCAKPQ